MNHSCTQNRVEHIASAEQPFRFVDSGLSYVFLVGIKYYTCECGRIIADIPAIKELMQLIARDLVEKPTSLTGEEIRFLRKRLGKKQADFAHDLGIEPETLNRYENEKTPISETSDKLARLYYLAFSTDQMLSQERKALEEILANWKSSRESKKITKIVTDNEWRDLPVAA
jgi:transcriptional regulator with XRE-family HTH domain